MINNLRARVGNAPVDLPQAISEGLISYVPMPAALHGKYQSFTEADISLLRQQGYSEQFLNVEQGVSRYMDFLEPILNT